MSAPIAPNSAEAAEFHSLDNLEAQALFLITKLTSKENIFNTSNPTALSNRATVAINYDQRTATGQITLALADNAIEGKLVDSILPFLP